jgi:hypothetical protein
LRASRDDHAVTQRARLGPHTVNRIGFGAMQLAGPHLYRIYPKLGVSSRSELAAALAPANRDHWT